MNDVVDHVAGWPVIDIIMIRVTSTPYYTSELVRLGITDHIVVTTFSYSNVDKNGYSKSWVHRYFTSSVELATMCNRAPVLKRFKMLITSLVGSAF